jgi:hypothetical protein
MTESFERFGEHTGKRGRISLLSAKAKPSCNPSPYIQRKLAWLEGSDFTSQNTCAL